MLFDVEHVTTGEGSLGKVFLMISQPLAEKLR